MSPSSSLPSPRRRISCVWHRNPTGLFEILGDFRSPVHLGALFNGATVAATTWTACEGSEGLVMDLMDLGQASALMHSRPMPRLLPCLSWAERLLQHTASMVALSCSGNPWKDPRMMVGEETRMTEEEQDGSYGFPYCRNLPSC